MQILSGNLKCVDRLVFAPDGSRLAVAGGEYNPIEVFAFDTPSAPVALPVKLDVNCYQFAFDPSGEVLVVVDDFTLVGFDTVTGEEVWRLTTTGEMLIGGMDIAPDGRLAFGYIYQYHTPRGYQVWNLTGREWPKQVRATAGTPDFSCHGVKFVADGGRIAFAEYGDSGGVRFNVLPTTGRARGRVLESEMNDVLQLASHGNLLAALAKRLVWVWDVNNPEPLAGVSVKGRKAMTGIAFHPSGKFLAVTSNDETVTLFDTRSWQPVRTFTWKVGRLRGVAFSPDGTRAAVGSDTGKIVVWDVDV